MQFNKFKVIVAFKPDAYCILHMSHAIIPWYSFEHKVDDKLFKPMRLAPYYYNSKVPTFDWYETAVRKVPIIFPYSSKNKFIKDQTAQYPCWFGYFDSMLHANKEYKCKAKGQIIACLKDTEHVNDVQLFDEISKFKFSV